jgi:hypothetical protein
VRNTIACQLKRFALGADVEGADAHVSFPMMAVVGRALRLEKTRVKAQRTIQNEQKKPPDSG